MTRIIKSSGDSEAFSRDKLLRSLRRAGASKNQAEAVWREMAPEIRPEISTQHLQRRAIKHLKRVHRVLAARYQLKKAIMELGPSGYPFERLIGELFMARGYTVEVGQLMQGHCVQHEVDVLAHKPTHHVLVECKYRNTPGYKCDVKVPLYIQSRFEDIRRKKGWSPEQAQGWIVTNTRFSSDAIQYAECMGLHLLGWDYPERSLKYWLEHLHLYPLTVLTSLSKPQKNYLLEHNLVLCRDVLDHPELLWHLPGRNSNHLPPRILSECREILRA